MHKHAYADTRDGLRQLFSVASDAHSLVPSQLILMFSGLLSFLVGRPLH
jgi:hypothetical protein